jgi:dCMP deaminase
MKYSELSKWDKRFLDLARTVGLWSKGPRKHVGAVIVRPDRSVASMGYNGPPRGFDDDAFLRMSRGEQHKVVVHAEVNAIRQMTDSERLTKNIKEGYTLYVSPLYPCKDCALSLSRYKIPRVVAYCGQSSADWLESAKAAEEVFKCNNIEYIFVTD